MIIQSKRVWLQEQWASVQIEILDQRIERILAYNQEPVDVDYGNLRVYPGFMDTHLHGVKGVDATDANADTLMKIAKELLKEGITGFCLTTVTQSEEVLMKALRECALAIKNQSEGSQMLGIHFEGPYLKKSTKVPNLNLISSMPTWNNSNVTKPLLKAISKSSQWLLKKTKTSR